MPQFYVYVYRDPSRGDEPIYVGKGKGIPRPRITCPHCGKEGGAPQMKQWHFDNCGYHNGKT